MGRKIRKVPPNWKHPKDNNGQYIPMVDDGFKSALDKWITQYNLWEAGKHPNQKEYPDETKCEYWEWDDGPPSPEYHRPEFKEKPTWFQVYETVSEGTPVTPTFETKAELIKYLVETGSECSGKWSQKAAENFGEKEWAPSCIISGGKIYRPHEIID